MWVKFKKSYVGPLGQFSIGSRQDLPDATAKHFIAEKFAVGTCAPWDDHKDKKQAKKLAAKEALLAQEANLGKLITGLEKELEAAEAAVKKIPAIKEFLPKLKKRYDAVLEQLESFTKGKKDAKPDESEPAAGTDAAGTEAKNDDDAAGQAASSEQAQE